MGRDDVIMTEIIIPNKKDPHDVDAKKDCPDFVPLNDGTIAGDRKYCDRSTLCRQFDANTNMGFYSEWHKWCEFYTDENGQMVSEDCMDYLCTGKFPIFEERMEDEKAT